LGGIPGRVSGAVKMLKDRAKSLTKRSKAPFVMPCRVLDFCLEVLNLMTLGTVLLLFLPLCVKKQGDGSSAFFAPVQRVFRLVKARGRFFCFFFAPVQRVFPACTTWSFMLYSRCGNLYSFISEEK